MSDYLLSSRYTSMYIGRGDVGLTDIDSSTKASTPSKNGRNLPPPKGLDDVIKSVIGLCNDGSGKLKASISKT